MVERGRGTPWCAHIIGIMGALRASWAGNPSVLSRLRRRISCVRLYDVERGTGRPRSQGDGHSGGEAEPAALRLAGERPDRPHPVPLPRRGRQPLARPGRRGAATPGQDPALAGRQPDAGASTAHGSPRMTNATLDASPELAAARAELVAALYDKQRVDVRVALPGGNPDEAAAALERVRRADADLRDVEAREQLAAGQAE